MIGRHAFGRKGELEFYVKQILAEAESAVDLPSEQAQFMLDFFTMHPQWEQKQSKGVLAIRKLPDGNGNYCFNLVKRGGLGLTDISYIITLANLDWRHRRLVSQSEIEVPNQRANVVAALRNEVDDTIDNARLVIFADGPSVPSVLTPDAVVYRHNCHIDHAPPNTFAVLVGEWLADRDLATIEITAGDNITRHTLIDRDLAATWKRYHDDRAELRAVTPDENQNVEREQRRRLGLAR